MLKLGKLPPRRDARTLRLSSYVRRDRLPIPPACDWIGLTTRPFGLYANDAIGDCTVAAAAHLVQAWTAARAFPSTWPVARGRETILDEGDVLRAYAEVSAFVPGKPETDVGATALDLLKFWRRRGIGGHRIGAFVSVDHARPESLRAAIALFGGCYLGLDLPEIARRHPWTAPPVAAASDAARGSWGGHAVALLGYDSSDNFTCITWGAPRRMSASFLASYADEAWAVLSPDFLFGGVAPNGFAIDVLRADLERLASRVSPHE